MKQGKKSKDLHGQECGGDRSEITCRKKKMNQVCQETKFHRDGPPQGGKLVGTPEDVWARGTRNLATTREGFLNAVKGGGTRKCKDRVCGLVERVRGRTI